MKLQIWRRLNTQAFKTRRSCRPWRHPKTLLLTPTLWTWWTFVKLSQAFFPVIFAPAACGHSSGQTPWTGGVQNARAVTEIHLHQVVFITRVLRSSHMTLIFLFTKYLSFSLAVTWMKDWMLPAFASSSLRSKCSSLVKLQMTQEGLLDTHTHSLYWSYHKCRWGMRTSAYQWWNNLKRCPRA